VAKRKIDHLFLPLPANPIHTKNDLLLNLGRSPLLEHHSIEEQKSTPIPQLPLYDTRLTAWSNLLATSLTVDADIRSPKSDNNAAETFLVLIPNTKQAMII